MYIYTIFLLPNQLLPNHFSDENFKRQILRPMSIIHFKLDQLTEDFAKLFRNNINGDETQQIEESIFDKFNFPLITIGELKDLDTYLKIADNKTKVVRSTVLFYVDNYLNNICC